MRILTILALAVVLIACQPQPAAPTDLTPVLDAIANLDERVNVLTAHVDTTNDRVVQTENSLRAQLVALSTTAADLGALARQPLRLSDVDLASIEVLLITTSPDVLDFLVIEPGACPEDTPAPRNAVHPGEAIVTVAWPAPTGPHCITSPETDDRPAFAATVHVPAGSIGGITLLPPTE